MNTSALFRALFRLALFPLLFLGLGASSAVLPTRAAGTISLGALDTAYTQNFDTLANSGTSSTVPTGWDFSESGTNANTTYTAGTGSSNTGDTYSFGASGNTERALGGLLSSNLNPTFGASFTNNTGSTITSLDISYTGEQWRLGTSGRGADRIEFQYSTNAISLTTGTWITVTALIFNSPVTTGTVGALNGNDAANRTALSASISGLNILNSSTFWIRWSDFNVSSSDDGLGVDDFSLTPRGSSGDSAPAVASTSPTSGATGIALDSNLTVNFSEPVDVAVSWYTISCATSGSHTASVTGGPTSFSLDPTTDFVNSETCTITILAVQVTDQDTNDPPDNMLADYGWSFTTFATSRRIRDIQGTSHISPLNGQAVANVPGIVTAQRSTGFYLQDPSPDADDATSEGIFVYTATAPTVNIGDSVQVSGTVSEYRPGGSGGTANLTTTEIGSPTIVVLSSGNPLPTPVVIGSGGRVPPTTVIDDDASGDVETSGVFEPANDGIDFYESLEAMRVQINNAVVVGPASSFGEVPVLPDNGASASVRTARGGIVVRSTDFNPERVMLDDEILKYLSLTMPSVNVGDSFTAVVGVMDYAYANFKLQVTQALTATAGGLGQETTTAQTGTQLSVATFNVENLDSSDGQAKFDGLANLIVNHLKAPDLLAVEEVQDNNGATNDAVVDASTTWNMLITAIQNAGGPTYQYRQIDPSDDQDGGELGGNIRQGFLFRTDRGLAFVDRSGAGATTANSVVNSGGVPQLQYSPGRIDPTNSAFNASRKPLAGEFTFGGALLFAIANHWNSKGGDNPLFGHYQPPVLSSETKRNQQATVVRDFVTQILAVDPTARVIVLGDLNDFEFSTPLNTLKNGGMLTTLMEVLPQNERYTYVYEGNSQALDHIVVSSALSARRVRVDVVHVNAEFATHWSDHDPVVAVFDLARQLFLPIILK